MSASDQDLIQACRRGDARAWERLLDKYERLVFSIPLNYGLSHQDAADITQLTFMILIQSLDTLLVDSHLGAWLATVARRHTWRLLKRNQREPVSAEVDLAEGAGLLGKAGLDSIEHWELIEWLDHSLAQIGERCRKLLLALYFEPQQPAYPEIAERFDMPVGSIGPTRARCLARLKQVMQAT
jgi:RNA polymerase sigma factor (sigma-70 family)